jgi:uncharacterized membrane protein
MSVAFPVISTVLFAIVIAIIVLVIWLIVKAVKAVKAHFERVARIESALAAIREELDRRSQI